MMRSRGNSASTPRTSSTAARQRASQSVKRVEEQARGELGIEVGALLGQRLPVARDVPDVLEPRRAQQECRLGLSAVDRCDRVVGLRVLSLDGQRARPFQVLVRTVLLCLFLPAMFWDKDGRSLHDKAAGTLIVRA